MKHQEDGGSTGEEGDRPDAAPDAGPDAAPEVQEAHKEEIPADYLKEFITFNGKIVYRNGQLPH